MMKRINVAGALLITAGFAILLVTLGQTAFAAPAPESPATGLGSNPLAEFAALDKAGRDAFWERLEKLAPKLDAPQMDQLRTTLKQAIVHDAAVLSTIGIEELRRLDSIQKEIGASDTERGAITAAWIVATPAWKQLDPAKESDALVWLVTSSRASDSQSTQSAADMVVKEIWDGYLHNPAQLRRWSASDLAEVAPRYKPILRQGQKQALAEQLSNKIAKRRSEPPPPAAEEFARCVGGIVTLGQGDSAASTLLTLFQNDPKLLAPHDMTFFTVVQGALDCEVSLDLHRRLLVQVVPMLLEANQRAIPGDQSSMNLVRWYVEARDYQTAREHAQAFYRRIVVDNSRLGDIAPNALFELAACISWADYPNEGKLLEGYPQYGRALSANLKKVLHFEETEGEYTGYLIFASPLATPEAQALIEAKLKSSDIEERIIAAKIVTVLRKLDGRLPQWQQEIDRKLKDPSLDRDGKAEWLLVRAFATEYESWSNGTFEGRRYLDQALAIVKSEATRLICVRFLVRRYVATMKSNEAISFIDSVESHFSSPESKQKLSDLRTWASTLGDYYRGAVVVANQERVRRRLQGQLNLLEHQLALSRKRGKPAEALASLSEQILQTQSQLASMP